MRDMAGVNQKLDFSVIGGDAVSLCQWREVSALFSSAYGVYSDRAASQRAGERIRLGVGYYERSYATPDFRVAFCRDGEALVAEAIYREVETERGRVAFVVQLVVAEAYRRRGVASTLLHAVWGFSNYYAWGIVTSNAFTVESLESATFRRADPIRISERAAWLRREVLSGIPFLAEVAWTCDGRQSRIDSGFYTARVETTDGARRVADRLGSLEEGEEWLAVVFHDQEPDDFAAYQAVINASSDFVAEAYRRMPQSAQPWAREPDTEIDEILRALPELSTTARIADFGAGSGRHLVSLRNRGFRNLVGIDMVSQRDADASVIVGDCRTWISSDKFDVILCLYDVVGSYAEEEDNKAILRNIAANLKTGGRAVIFVSNFAYLDRTKCAEVDFGDPESAAKAIFSLRPSRAMGTNGEFFDQNCLLVDVKRHLVCHKEQFASTTNALPGEYLIRDRRFTLDEIKRWASECGLTVTSHRFVRAGFEVDYAETDGKEILVITRKDEPGALGADGRDSV